MTPRPHPNALATQFTHTSLNTSTSARVSRPGSRATPRAVNAACAAGGTVNAGCDVEGVGGWVGASCACRGEAAAII